MSVYERLKALIVTLWAFMSDSERLLKRLMWHYERFWAIMSAYGQLSWHYERFWAILTAFVTLYSFLMYIAFCLMFSISVWSRSIVGCVAIVLTIYGGCFFRMSRAIRIFCFFWNCRNPPETLPNGFGSASRRMRLAMYIAFWVMLQISIWSRSIVGCIAIILTIYVSVFERSWALL